MASVTWCIGFPYCPNEPIRAESFAVIQAFYEREFPGIPQYVHSATALGEPFERSKTRNQLVATAEAAGFDIITLIDADTLLHPDGLRQMVARVTDEPGLLGKPFHRGVNLTLEAQTALANSDFDTWPSARFNDPGAAWVIRPETWWRAGGMDEALGAAWGADDNAHMYLHGASGGTIAFADLPAVKTEHPAARWSDDPYWPDTVAREIVCHEIWRNPALFDEWLSVRDQDGIVDVWVDRLGIRAHIENKLATQAQRRARRERIRAAQGR